jgi:circadian clock protein KaiB
MKGRKRAAHASTGSFEAAVVKPTAAPRFALRLYIAGTSERSLRAIQNARELCEGELAGRCDLEVIDIFQQPARARLDQILAVPTLVKRLPLPVKKLIGDLSDRARLLVGLGLTTA